MHKQNNDTFLDHLSSQTSKLCVNNNPPSPISMQFVDTIDNTPLSPAFDNSPANTTLYYMNDESTTATAEGYQQHLQYQLQLQYQFREQQYIANDRSVAITCRSQYHVEDPYNNNDIYHLQVVPPPQPSNTIHRSTNHVSNSAAAGVSLTSHNVVHNRSEPRKRNSRKRIILAQLQCTICFKIFSRPYNLKSHQKTHTKERPFICLFPGCNWAFARPHDLKRHDLLHTGEKPYGCSCGKRFDRSDAVKRHQLTDSICATTSRNNNRRKHDPHL
jgi:hypothetical protein